MCADAVNDGASRIERDLGLRLASEEATRKLFPASGDAREVRALTLT